MKRSTENRILVSSILSGVFEYYDFIIFIVMAKFLTEIFLNNNDAISYTLMISSGFFARFFGGIIFGYLADKTGINKTFSLTLVLMLLSCILISILPTYRQVGFFSIIMLFSIRMIQGASLGGEIPISVVFSLENCVKIKNYFISSSLFFGFTIGTLLAYTVVYAMNSIFSHQQIQSFAWRIPFLLGCLLMLISLFIRKNIFKNNNKLLTLKNKYYNSLKLSFKNIFQGFLLVSVPTLLYNMIYFQSTIYISKKYPINNDVLKPYVIESVLLTGLLSIFLSLIFNNYNRIYKIGLVISIFMVPILIHYIFLGKISYVQYALIYFSIPASMMFSGLYCILFDLFNKQIKVLSIAISINLANVIFSSFSYFMLYLFDNYFSILSVITGIFCLFVLFISNNIVEKNIAVKRDIA